jgi:hypothetical protein
MGGLGFIRYFAVCALGGAAASFLLALFGPVGTVVGSSAAVLGVALAFAFYWPNTDVYVFPLPVPVKVKWLVAALFAMDLLMGLTGRRDGIAHFAHVGGFLFGFAYLKIEQVLAGRTRVTPVRRSEARVLARPAGESVRARAQQPPPRARADATQREVDRVLDKISATGMDSLTAEERRFLDEMSRQLKRD